nr:MAG TPA: hypothetical protein [Caudoviricetes sp.]
MKPIEKPRQTLGLFRICNPVRALGLRCAARHVNTRR